jgi:hypothetical protein
MWCSNTGLRCQPNGYFVGSVPTGSGQQRQHFDLGPLVGQKEASRQKSEHRLVMAWSFSAIDGDGDKEMADTRRKSVCKTSVNVCLLGLFLFFFQTLFWLDGQAAAPIPHKSRLLLRSPN